MTDEVTVAELAAREGLVWPPDGPAAAPRHLLEEPDPQPGELTSSWFGAPAQRSAPRATRRDDAGDEGVALVRPYMTQAERLRAR